MNYHIKQNKNILTMNQPEESPLRHSQTPPVNELATAYLKDIELIKALYTELNAFLLPFVVEVIDSYDYNTSPIYDEDGISRETLAQLVSLVLDRAAEHRDDVDEIRLEVNSGQIIGGWDRNSLLKSLTEALVLTDIFMYRRPKRRMIYNSYVFKDGQYRGLKYS